MKSTLFLLVCICLFTTIGSAQATPEQAGKATQSGNKNKQRSKFEVKLRSDPTYSTHNYKHPNKAATARKWSTKSGVPVKHPANAGRVANYKQPVPGQATTGGIISLHTPSTALANRNYKDQRVNHNRQTSEKSAAVDKPAPQSVTGSGQDTQLPASRVSGSDKNSKRINKPKHR